VSVLLLAKRALPRALRDVPPPEVAAALARLPSAFGQLGLPADAANLNIKALKGQPGLYRLRVGDWRVVFVRTADGFLVSAIGLRKDIYQRVGRMRLARKGEGVRIIELPQPEKERSEARERAHGHAPARTPKAVSQNPLSVFSDAELLRIAGVDAALVAWLRALPESIDVGGAFARRLADPDLAVLLADVWERPGHHIGSFADGGAPRAEDLVLELEELAARLVASDSETEVVATETGAPRVIVGEQRLRFLLGAAVFGL
jgi:mRNA interferase RelE/StbE